MSQLKLSLAHSPEVFVIAIPISSEKSTKTRPKSVVLNVRNPFRTRSSSSEGRVGLLFSWCMNRISSTRRIVVISESDQPFSMVAAFLREIINREIMIGRKTSFPIAGRSWRVGWTKI